MSCGGSVRGIRVDANRFQKRYPIKRGKGGSLVPGYDGIFEVETSQVSIVNETIVTVNFKSPFSGVPNVSVTLYPNEPGVCSANAYVESVSTDSANVRVSAPVVGLLVFQALYIET